MALVFGILRILGSLVQCLGVSLRSRSAVAAENLFLRRQLALYQKRIRRECLDWLIPLSASHLRIVLKEWVRHYNSGRPHMSLGSGIPDPPVNAVGSLQRRYRLNADIVQARAVLGGLHHEYALVAETAVRN
jgi:transposase InsO family protein